MTFTTIQAKASLLRSKGGWFSNSYHQTVMTYWKWNRPVQNPPPLLPPSKNTNKNKNFKEDSLFNGKRNSNSCKSTALFSHQSINNCTMSFTIPSLLGLHWVNKTLVLDYFIKHKFFQKKKVSWCLFFHNDHMHNTDKIIIK